MRTAIVTDSNSGIFEDEGREKDVFVIPMPVMVEGETFYEGLNITHAQFFEFLSEGRSVSTSQPSIASILDVWNYVLQNGYDELVYIPMSSGLSSSCQTAQALALEFDNCVEVVDNHRVSVTQRHSVEDAIALREKGYNAKQIREILEKNAFESIVFVGVSTLSYLKASGRVTAAGTAMNIKPILVIMGDRLDAYAKVRGTKRCQARLIESMLEQADLLSSDGAILKFGVASSFSNQEENASWKQMVKKAFPNYAVRYDPLTFSISSHVGPDAFGMGISRKAIK